MYESALNQGITYFDTAPAFAGYGETILDHLPSHTSVRDLDGNYLLINAKYEELFGVNREQVIGKTFEEVLPPHYAKVARQRDEEILKHGRIIESERTMPSENGELTYISTVFPIFDSTDAIIAVGGSNFDITERKQAETELQESRNIFQALADNLPEFITMKDTEGRFLYVNRIFEEWTGISRDDIVGKTLQEVYAPEQAQELAGLDRKVIESGENFIREIEFTYPDGITRVGASTRFPITSSAGTVLGIGYINHDITERKQAEEELVRQKAIADTTLESMDQGIAVFDADYKLIAHNAKIEDMLHLPGHLLAEGTPVEEWYRYQAEQGDYGADDAFGAGDVKTQVAKRMKSIREDEALYYERVLRDGRVIEIRRNPIADGGFVSTFTDISERKQAEEALQNRTELVQLLSRTSTDANDATSFAEALHDTLADICAYNRCHDFCQKLAIKP